VARNATVGQNERMGRRLAVAVAIAAIGATASCGSDSPSDEGADVSDDAPDDIEVTSAAFEDGATIPMRFTCAADNVSPPLAWTGVPDEAQQLALVMDDPDAPSGTFTHWIVLGLEPDETSLAEDVDLDALDGIAAAEGSFGAAVYGGPCPPADDDPHRYRFTVYALDEELDPCAVGAGATCEPHATDDALALIDDHAIAEGTLGGRFGL